MSAATQPLGGRVTTQTIINAIKNNPIVVAIALLVIVTSFVEPKFLTGDNFDNIVRQFGTLIFAALGMTFVIMAGFIDLSIGGIISLVAVVTVTLIDPIGQGPAILVGVAVGLGCGLLNGALILTSGALTQAEALFITYGMSLVYGAVALMYVQGVTQFLTYSKTDTSLFDAINSGGVGILSVSAIMFLISLAILYVIQRRTYIGRAVVLTGGNKIAARLAGIPISRSIVLIYAISGMLSAIGAVVLVSRVTLADPTMGTPYMTQAILAVVVGGTALIGGRGSVIWTVVGTLLLILLNNSLNLLGVSSYVQFMLRGVILILAIWLDTAKQASVGR
ncbi:MAG: ABC transporter permease [Chloroflexi bacterium]|nr:ABC transporter permease [Chloroflexota bacterium]